ncbi:hypothetical protein DY218_09900 [Streptomyces triticagri]|uniref:Uncharacterized protein n=1 Tax=Streptomyces triticagri TaxID=2293568 RepID=A0A372M7M6_9ACTN|nr:hypothetical protein [Streptomyces triticagri]RFU86944.1 hypothetical protein DY218_09900 [Streptomyces triticagri]
MTTDQAPEHVDDAPAGRRFAPLVATLLLVPLLPVVFVFVGLSVMATDSCYSDCSQELLDALDAVTTSFLICLATTLVCLAAAWALPARHRFTAARIVLASTAVLVQFVPLLLVFTLPEG